MTRRLHLAFAASLMLGALLATPLAARPRAAAPAPGGYRVEDVLRVSGPPEMASLLKLWQDGFRRLYPQALFAEHLRGRDTAIYGIEMRTADVALLDRPINPFERYGTYEHSWIFPVQVEVATDGAVGVEEPATEAVFVRRDNPLKALSLEQLDGVFGAQRDGGWDKLDWNTDAARAAAGDIRRWGQLGMTGAMADAPIHVYGPASHGNGVVTYFQDRVLHGGAMRNEALREYADPKAMFADLAHDPQGIAYGPLGAMPAGFKVVAISPMRGEPAVLPTSQTLRARSYPLAKPIYLYFTIDTPSGQLASPRVAPKIKAFVSYILSPAGQAAVQRDGHYLPLTSAEAARQTAVLLSTSPPPERPL